MKGFILIAFCLFLCASARAEEPLRKLTFNEAIEVILKRSTDLAAQMRSLDATVSKTLPSRLFYLPTISIDVKEPAPNATFYWIPRQVELVSQMNLFRGGADWAQYQAAKADISSQETSVEAVTINVEEKAVQALVMEIQRQKEIEVDQAILRAREYSFSIASQRYKKGYLALQEVQKVTVDLQNAKAKLTDAQIQEVQARTYLEQLLGHTNIQIAWPWQETLKKARKDSNLLDRKLAVNNHPAWISANYQVEAESQRLKKNWRLLAPTLDAVFTYGTYRIYYGPANGWVPMSGWTGALTLNFALFDQLSVYSKAAEQSQLLAKSEIQLEQTRRDIQNQWDSSRQSFQLSLDSALLREEILKTSRGLYQSNQKRFQIGRISANDLILDQDRLFDSELFAIEGWSQAHLSYMRLCHSLGKRVGQCQSN